MTEQKFIIEVMHGPIEVSLTFTRLQMEAILLDTPEPLLTETFIQVLCQDETLMKKVQHFLNQADKDGHIAFVAKNAWLKNQLVYEVPLRRLEDDSIRPAIPIGYNATFFYTSGFDRVCVAVAATEDLALILEGMETARYLGVVDYDREHGIGRYEWEPDDE